MEGHVALRRGRVSLANQIYHVTASTRSREPLFTHVWAAHAACRCFADASLLGDASLLAWVLMPDHAHWLLQLGEEDALDTVVARLKSASARKANAAMGRNGAVWAKAYYDRALRSDDDMVDVARYIITNPLRKGLVNRIGDYPYWNAAWL